MGMKLLPIGKKKLININLVSTINFENVKDLGDVVAFYFATGSVTIASKLDFDNKPKRYARFREKLASLLSKNLVQI